LFDEAVREEIEQAAGQKGTTSADIGRLTTLGCGGPAAFLIEARSADSLAAILGVAADRKIGWFVIGLGSNLLVADSGWDGLLIRLTGELKTCAVRDDNRLDCGGGASLSRAAALAADAGLTGLEPLAGIPGTVGGAIFMNAGAWGTDIGRLTEQVEICLPHERRLIEAAALNFSYRHLDLSPGAIVSRVVLTLSSGEAENIHASMADYRRRREDSQPRGGRGCGSVFRNPEGVRSAGELLDEAGCKGLTHGDAIVSTKHANFIVNKGADAADIIWLMDECRRRVHEKSGIILEPEVRLLGDITLEQI